MSLEFETIKSNWGKYESLLNRLCDDNLNNLLSILGERILTCPSSPRTDSIGCYPGGLVEHTLEVAGMMRQLNDSLSMGVPILSIIKVGLLHDLGKIGDLESEHFIEQDSDWHRDKLGQMYKYNEEINKMSISHRTLYILQHFSVELSKDEWLAIQLAQGSHFEENKFYVGHEPSLAMLVQKAKSFASHKNKM